MLLYLFMTWKHPESFTGRFWAVAKAGAPISGPTFNIYGHQFVIHLKPRPAEEIKQHHNPVDGHDVPVPHYGVVLEWDEWHKLEQRLREHHVKFVIEPYIRFKGLPGEQATMFFLDPSGNALEFKSFKDFGQLFAV